MRADRYVNFLSAVQDSELVNTAMLDGTVVTSPITVWGIRESYMYESLSFVTANAPPVIVPGSVVGLSCNSTSPLVSVQGQYLPPN